MLSFAVRLTNKARTSVSVPNSCLNDNKENLKSDALNADSIDNYLASTSISKPIFDILEILDNSLYEF